MITEILLSYRDYRELGERTMKRGHKNKRIWLDSVSGILINLWRIAVRLTYMDRKGNLYCAVCHKMETNIPLDIHHIINKSQGIYAKYMPENGLPLCRECHNKAEEEPLKSKIYNEILRHDVRAKLESYQNNIVHINLQTIYEIFNNLVHYIDELLEAKYASLK